MNNPIKLVYALRSIRRLHLSTKEFLHTVETVENGQTTAIEREIDGMSIQEYIIHQSRYKHEGKQLLNKWLLYDFSLTPPGAGGAKTLFTKFAFWSEDNFYKSVKGAKIALNKLKPLGLVTIYATHGFRNPEFWTKEFYSNVENPAFKRGRPWKEVEITDELSYTAINS